MRKYAFIKKPFKCNDKDYIYKIMLYQTKKGGVFLFQYCSMDAVHYPVHSNSGERAEENGRAWDTLFSVRSGNINL